jgi:DNA polymerase-3 subunit epsilon
MTLPGLRERTGDTQLILRARQALAGGPLLPVELLGRVFALPDAPLRVAERIVEALFARHADFLRTPSGAWALVEGAAERPDRSADTTVTRLRYAVVDVETTGSGLRTGHRITEIAVVPVDGGVVGEPFVALVNPERSIPPQVVSLTRITWEMVRRAPRFADVATPVREQLLGRVFVAHNAAFDWRFVQAEVERAAGMRLEGDRVCTVRLARVVLPQLRRRSLDALANYFGVEIAQRHRAGSDALATARILCRLLELAEEQGLDSWPELSARLDQRTPRAKRPRSRMPRSMDFDCPA